MFSPITFVILPCAPGASTLQQDGNPWATGNGTMFETLDPLERTMDRQLPLFVYGIYSLTGLVFSVLDVRRHRFSQPFSLAIGTVMFFLSLTWLVTTLRSGSSVTKREFRFRSAVLLLLLFAIGNLPSLYR